jgi:hypothetical protein
VWWAPPLPCHTHTRCTCGQVMSLSATWCDPGSRPHQICFLFKCKHLVLQTALEAMF